MRKQIFQKKYEKIKSLEINEYSEIIEINNNLLILKVDDIRDVKKIIDKEKELERLILIEKNKKLEDYSIMYFNKVKMNYFIDEK